MITIRQNTFETNSSSTHSICICTKDQHNKWVHGELFLNESYDKDSILEGKEFITKEEAINFLKYYGYFDEENKDDLDYQLRDREIYSYSSWGDYYEHDSTEFTTPSGDEMVAECYYGYN